MKPHKHSELIKLWADGAEIETKFRDGEWFKTTNPGFYLSEEYEYRIKPEPKPDVVKYLAHSRGETWHTWMNPHYTDDDVLTEPQLKLTFDGKTGELKSAEVLK